MKEKYWKVLRYCIDYEYSKTHPVLMEVKICGESITHHWRLPITVLGSEDYDWTDAIERRGDIWT